MTEDKRLVSRKTDINSFLRQLANTPPATQASHRGRLIFAMDATASREASWDNACQIQGEMFSQTAALGSLDIQLCYYRGFGEFYASDWLDDASKLLRQMTGVYCLGGHTQIAKVLKQAIREAKVAKVNAVVFVGDCMEENVDQLCHLAGQLGLLGVPVFVFHEGSDCAAEKAFRQIARLTNGAYSVFDSNSARHLKDLLSAVAIFAVGGKKALENSSLSSSEIVKQLTHQLK